MSWFFDLVGLSAVEQMPMCTCGIFRTNSLVHTDHMEEKVNVLKILMSFELPY